MSSLVSVKGPSTTVRLLALENLMRAPFELGWRPERSSSTPAFISSSLYLPIAESDASLGITPASDSLLAFTTIMNFMVIAPSKAHCGFYVTTGFCQYVESRRSEEHTSELQSHSDLVCRLLLEKKKKKHKGTPRTARKHNRQNDRHHPRS